MTRQKDEEKQQQAVEDSFPASDPPGSTGITGPRAVGPARQSRPDQRDDDSRKKDASPRRRAPATAYHGENEKHRDRR